MKTFTSLDEGTKKLKTHFGGGGFVEGEQGQARNYYYNYYC